MTKMKDVIQWESRVTHMDQLPWRVWFGSNSSQIKWKMLQLKILGVKSVDPVIVKRRVWNNCERGETCADLALWDWSEEMDDTILMEMIWRKLEKTAGSALRKVRRVEKMTQEMLNIKTMKLSWNLIHFHLFFKQIQHETAGRRNLILKGHN